MNHIFDSWYLSYWVCVGAIVLFISVFVNGNTPNERGWKRVLASVLLTGMCALIFWSTFKEEDMAVTEDLQVIAAKQHIPIPDLWWRMH